MRTMKTKEIIGKLNEILIGYYHYYGVYVYYPAVVAFRWHVLKSLFYWFNRRSQKKGYNWPGFLDMIKFGHPLARPKSFYVSTYEQCTSNSAGSRMWRTARPDLRGSGLVMGFSNHPIKRVFAETFKAPDFAAHCIPAEYVQDNESCSGKGVLRGLHFQKTHTQGKLVRVTSGKVYDVVVDVRSG